VRRHAAQFVGVIVAATVATVVEPTRHLCFPMYENIPLLYQDGDKPTA